MSFFGLKSCSCVFLVIAERKHSNQIGFHTDAIFLFLIEALFFFSEVTFSRLSVTFVLVTVCTEGTLAMAVTRIAYSCSVSVKLIGSLVNLSLFAVTTDVSQ